MVNMGTTYTLDLTKCTVVLAYIDGIVSSVVCLELWLFWLYGCWHISQQLCKLNTLYHKLFRCIQWGSSFTKRRMLLDIQYIVNKFLMFSRAIGSNLFSIWNIHHLLQRTTTEREQKQVFSFFAFFFSVMRTPYLGCTYVCCSQFHKYFRLDLSRTEDRMFSCSICAA